ncbi:MAG: hypothetical protein L3J04_10155 [Robiginitomaculum sp.]|nr:hypothetical protein [Robiginitomaculum sp.]
MARLTKTTDSVLLTTLIGHLLCCGLPVAVNLMALLAGLGALSAITPWVGELHDTLHQFELIMLLVSGAALVFGFWVHIRQNRIDCSKENCDHKPCATQKRQSRIILIIASALFLLNLANYIWHLGQ